MQTTNKTIHSPTGRMAELLKRLNLIANEEKSSVLFIGETGTGKELLAQEIVAKSPRKDKLTCPHFL